MSRLETNSKNTDSQLLNRRELLGLTLAAGLSLVKPTTIVFEQASAHEKKETSEVVEALLAFEAMIGDRELTTQEAMDYAPLVSALYVEAIHPEKTVTDFASHTYIVPPTSEIPFETVFDTDIDISDGGIPFISPLTAHLEKTYPNIKMPFAVGKEIVLGAYDSQPIQGMTFFNKNMYIFLERTNNAHFNKKPGVVSSHTQFDEIDDTVYCEDAHPITRLRQTILHEHAHADLTARNDQAGTRGFTVRGTANEKYDYFEEFFADYVAAAISDHYDLPFTTGYSFEPNDLKNLSLVLKQSDISLRELATLHRYSRLYPFMKAVGDAVEISTDDRSEYAEAKNRVMRALVNQPSHVPDWDIIDDSFPGVSAREHVYDLPVTLYPSVEHALQGCTIDKP